MPEYVGLVERKHRHIIETGLTLLHNAVVPIHFWAHAFQTATYLINRLPTSVLGNNTPYCKLFGHNQHTLAYDCSGVFATHAFIHTTATNWLLTHGHVYTLDSLFHIIHFSALTSILIGFLCLAMSCFLKISFHSRTNLI